MQESSWSPAARPHVEHVVQFYADDDFLLDGLEASVNRAVEGGDAAICILTRVHAEDLAKRFEVRGRDMTIAIEEGRYVTLDAAGVMSALMPAGKFEEARFSELFSSLIVNAENALKKGGGVSVFGEAVALACSREHSDDVIRWERACTSLAETTGISVSCCYSDRTFDLPQDSHYFQKICSEHSSVIVSRGLPVVSSGELHVTAQADFRQISMQAERLMRSNRSLRYAGWEDHYRAALLETDRHKLFKRLEVAEAAVLTRLQALPSQADELAERTQLMHAWSGLQLIKSRKLGFPAGSP